MTAFFPFLPFRDDWALVGLCYPSDTTFQIMADINDRQSNTFDDLTDYGTVSSLAELENRPMERKYYFDRTAGWEHKTNSCPLYCSGLKKVYVDFRDFSHFLNFNCIRNTFIGMLLFPHISLSVFNCGPSSRSPSITPSLLWFYLRARHGREGHSYCSAKGCERVKVMATTSSKQTCNCTAKAYPKYSKTPSAVVPMPSLNTQPCKGCGAKKVWVALFI